MNVVQQSLYIGGEWVTPSTSRTIDVVSASTEEPIGSVPEAAEADVDAAVAAARRAFDDPQGWRSWRPIERAASIERLADALDARADEMAQRVSAQNGMPITTAREVEGAFPQAVLRLYAELIRDAVLEDIRPGRFGGRIKVSRSPVGVIGGIVPWNFPQTLAAFKLGPALAMGCTLVLKPSPETVLDAQLFAEAVHEAELPSGVINVVAGGREIGQYLVEHPGIDKVAFTGSTAAGRSIAETCGRLLRPVTLELGGKSAAIVLDDADLSTHLDN
ncbi:MAG TPA: aldehyde dehydrogenase family protein, partial [Mycobacterium sp.]